MSIGLPAHLRPQSVSRAFSSAAHIGALACIAAALAMVTVVQAEQPDLVLWPALIAMVPMIVALVLLDRHRTLFFSIAYVVVGGASTYWFALTALSQYSPLTSTDGFVLSLPRIALLLTGGVGSAFVSGIVWGAIGLIAAEIAIVVAAVQADAVLAVDGTSLACFALIAVTLLLLQYGQRWVIAVQPSLHRAARDEELASVRYNIEVRAAAVMHDTVLGHLAAIASAPSGPLGSTLQAQVERDLEVLVGEEWLAEPSSTVAVQARAGWQQSPLFAAIRDSRELGLEIEVTGDLASAARIDGVRAKALALAVKQCLVNVLRHSGTRRAEVVIFGSESELSVMVIDGGRGFSESETSVDRLGLRQSVRKRMEVAGGSVTVWSTVGRGTSVMIRVPMAGQPTEVPA
ncbi:hypothetical protein BH10ACT7_BH10ACT7_20660 [soil metagenome]